jgi:hypothetical protein
MGGIQDSDRLAIAIYNATIMDNRAFVPMADIDRQLTAEGVDCEAAKHTLFRQGVVGKSLVGTYALSSRGITRVRLLLRKNRAISSTERGPSTHPARRTRSATYASWGASFDRLFSQR